MTRLLSITWFLDSPFGTYLDGDYIEVWWDNESNIFSVLKNAVEITSGGDIPFQSWNYAGLPDTDYKEELAYQSSICNGIDLLNFARKPQFPYLGYTTILNHPTCIVDDPDNPVVCDLAFNSLPEVTNTSTDTSFDGQIVVIATGSNGAIKYKLNSDFEYNDGTGQSSGTFTGLAKGDYQIFARDAINCVAVVGVRVQATKTYGTLYQIEYYDNRLAAHHKTEVLEKDYAGSLIEIKAASMPTVYSLRGEGETDKFTPILTGEIVFTLMSETDGYFRELYTNDPEKFRLKHSIDSGSGYSVVWTGKILPNQFQEAYKSPPYEIQAVAADGLAILKDIFLLDDIGNRLTGQYKQIKLIAWILNKIGLGLNIRSASNIYALTMNSAASDDPLDQAYVDVERYYLLTENPTCYDVLSYLLRPYGAQIILYYNVWNIIRVEERFSSFAYREYNSSGTYVSNSTYNPVKDIKNSSQSSRMVWMNQDQILKINPGYGNLRLLYNLGLETNLVLNGNFQVRNYATYQTTVSGLELVKGTIIDMRGFQVVNNECIISTGVEYLEPGNVALEILCNNHPSSTFSGAVPYKSVGYLVSDVQTLKMGNTDSLKINYRVKISPQGASTSSFWVKARIKIKYGDYFLTKEGVWTLTDTDIRFYIDKSQFNTYQIFEVISEGFPDTSYLSGEPFFVICYTANYYDTDYTTVAGLKAKVTTSLEPGYREEIGEPGGDYSYYELEENTSANDDVLIVRPNDYNASTNPVQWIRKFAVGTIRMTSPPNGASKLYIDKIQVEYLSNFKSLPEYSSYTEPMENANPLNLESEIFHGSLIYNGLTTTVHHERNYSPRGDAGPTYIISYDDIFFKANSANITYSGYLRNSSGVGFTLWQRDSIVGQKELEKIYVDMITAQYNRPWFSIHGGMTGDLLFTPIDTLRETMDDNRKYFPIYLSIDYRNNFYDAQLLEISDVASASEGAAEFNNDYNLDYTA